MMTSCQNQKKIQTHHPRPHFSEQELEPPKKGTKGKATGRDEATQSQNKIIQDTLRQISNQIPPLFEQEAIREQRYANEVMALIDVLFSTLYPHYAKLHGLGALKDALTNILRQQQDQQKIEIFVHPDDGNAIADHIQSQPIADRIIVSHRDAIARGACEITWHNGGASYNPHAIAEEIRAFLLRGLEETGQTRDDIKLDVQTGTLGETTGLNLAQDEDNKEAQPVTEDDSLVPQDDEADDTADNESNNI